MKKRDPLQYYFLEMREHSIEVPYFDNKPRRIRVLLPKDYRVGTEERYPVLYMHDGQNVFYSKESYSGYSWKIIPTLKYHNEFPKMIVVGIDNAEIDRLDEYGPWQTDVGNTVAARQAGGLGMEYGKWVVEQVKPFIDETYRTLPDRANTLLAGSSMGGIITAYMGSAYPEVFGHLGVFSLASWFSEPMFLDFIRKNPLNPESKVFIQVGTNEGDAADAEFISNLNQAYIDCSLNYYQTLLRSGTSLDNIRLRLMANEIHHEKHWAEHFIEFLSFAFLNK